MNQKNNYFKNLFKTELNKDLFKVILVLFIYIIVLFIFKSGYDYQSIIPFKEKEEVVEVDKVTYNLKINNQDTKVEFDSRKSLLSILESVSNLNIDIVRYYQGVKVNSINGSQNIVIKINGSTVKENLLDDKYNQIETETKIEVSF